MMYFTSVSAVVIGLVTYGIVTGVSAQNAVQVITPTPPVFEQVGGKGERARERHPHIHLAIKDLRAAREELKEADHDFGGHREDAMKAIDVAIAQLEVALKFDRK